MGQTLLTKDQQFVIKLFAQETSLHHFYLSGGTALAEFYLHHRDSDDLDFFSEIPFDLKTVEAFVKKITDHFGGVAARLERLYDRKLFFIQTKTGELKLEFSLYPFPALEEKNITREVRVDSKRDITANKLAALLDRFEPKDFVDLYFLLQERTIEDVQCDVEKKFGLKISALSLAGELAKVRRIETLPRMHVPITIEELKTYYANLIKTLKPAIFEF